MTTQRVGIALVAALLITACASGSSSSGPQQQSDLITAEEIASTNVSNLYQLIDRLRPRWLDVRSQQSFSSATEIVVFQGQTFLGGIDMLRQLGPDVANAIRYLDGPTASASLSGIGSRQVEGAIVINPSR